MKKEPTNSEKINEMVEKKEEGAFVFFIADGDDKVIGTARSFHEQEESPEDESDRFCQILSSVFGTF